MPPLISPSPVILDQSFPLDDETLELVAAALGNIEGLVQQGVVVLALTATLQLFVDEFDWQRTGPHPTLQMIYNLLVQWFLQPHNGLVILDLSSVPNCGTHPIPSDCDDSGLITLWAEEVAKLLQLYEGCEKPQPYWVAVGCHHAFAGEPIGVYKGGTTTNRFPLVGKTEIPNLGDAYDWQIPSDLHLRQVSFHSAKKNVVLLGAVPVRPPRGGGSHYKVSFPGAPRSWVLDPNEDPLKDDFLKELVPILGLPFEVIKTALADGYIPEKTLKLHKSNCLPANCILLNPS
jgi:hypothetical protein